MITVKDLSRKGYMASANTIENILGLQSDFGSGVNENVSAEKLAESTPKKGRHLRKTDFVIK